jgi:exonuclease III
MRIVMDNLTKGTLNVLQWNARSILPKIHFLQNLVHRHNLDIIAICESWLTEEGRLALRGYDIIRKDRADGYGGVLLAVKQDLRYQVLQVHSSTRIELLAISIDLCGNQKLQITVAYVHESKRVGIDNSI